MAKAYISWSLSWALVLGLSGMAGAQNLVSHGISTYGDLALPPDFKHLPYVNPNAPKGGELSQSWFGGFDSMNPFSVQGRAAIGSNMMLESILTGTMDEIGASYCLLCQTMEYPEDRSWVIFNLRENIRFSDGTPLTAEDVLFSYETFLTKGLSDFRQVFSQQVEKAEVLGPHQIKFTFKPDAPLHEMPQSVGGLPVFSKAQFEAAGLDMEESSLTPYIGSGPYVADKIDVGRSITYKRNPDYWGADLPINIGHNNFDSLRWEYFAEPNAAFEAFKGGAYTMRVENTSRIWAEQYNFPAFTKGHVVKDTIRTGDKASGQSMVFNLRRPQWQDPRVRQAVAMMFNFEWTNKALFYGLYTRIDSFWENSWLEAEGAPSPAEVALLQPLVAKGVLAENILTDEPVMAPVSRDGAALDRRNQRAAALLLEEAGYKPGADGLLRNEKGETLVLEVLDDNPQFERVYAPFVENLRSLGIDAKLNMIDSAQYEVRTRNPAYDFDLTGARMRTNYFSGAELKQYYGSQTADISVFNLAGLKSPAVDQMIDVILKAKTKDDLTVATKAMDRILRAEAFRIPQWYNRDAWLAYYDFYEHPEQMPPYGIGLESIWWANEEKAAALKAAGALR